ncbi:alpha/beta hydrolase [Salinimonas sp. HHU 13199]|uniref:Alpha/beta hydrolase n=1 Tax=Salinimonas profundi TaxID=2729140 RepID=A0ABR8LG32_9ALTE|nr:alpha/beta hydrolase [Salinimonas profundi]MBD3585213.1 alpha/beta hydrolase [Salinimonas profundi]
MNCRIISASLLFLLSGMSVASERISLPVTSDNPTVYENEQRAYFSALWNTQVVSNVSSPTLTAFLPEKNNGNSPAVIVAPGGALYALSINSEGNDVARWLADKGIAAFVLRYRLVPTQKDATAQLSEEWEADYQIVLNKADKILPLAIEDGLSAVNYVRTHAASLGVNPEKIGFMGFSAGGAVAMGVSYQYDTSTRPDFLIPVYPWTDAIAIETPKADAPPMIVIAATNDSLGLAEGAVDLYRSYLSADKNAAMHLYAQGDHGFGMKTQGLPSDDWIERVYEWLVAEGWVSASN